MDSDSDDDFLSADEGDDEILEKIPEVIEITAKTETLSIKDTPKRTDEDTCSKDDIDSNEKEEEEVSSPGKEVLTEKHEAAEPEVSVEKEVPTEMSPDKESTETVRKPRRVKRLGDKSEEADSKKNEPIDVASKDEIVKEETAKEEDSKVEIEESNSEKQYVMEDVKNEDEQIEENSAKTDRMVENLEDSKHGDELNKEKGVEKSDAIENQLKDQEEKDNLKEETHEQELKDDIINKVPLENTIKDKDGQDKLIGEHEDSNEEGMDEAESAHDDESEEDVLKTNEINETEIQESDILTVDGSDKNDANNKNESKETTDEETVVNEKVCLEDDNENLETDDLSKKLPVEEDVSKHADEIIEDTVESGAPDEDKEPTEEDTSVEGESKEEPKEDEPTNNEVAEKAPAEKAPAEKVPAEKAPIEKKQPEKVQKPRKIKRLGVKTEKLGSKTSSKSSTENTEQTNENLKKDEEGDDGWNNDDFTDDFSSKKKKVEESSSTTPGKDGDWGWDSWADNIISQATNKVTDLMETVEGQLGIPDPNRLAKNIKAAEIEREKEIKESTSNDDKECNTSNSQEQPKENLSSWFSSFVPVNSISNLVQITGQDLVTGGIDALEYLGKSTVNYISEGDPGLRNKRKALFERKKGPSLASVLQEAKLKTEEKELSGALPAGEDPKKLNDMLEKFQALAHMDAIQMLSNENAAKVKRILNVQSEEAKLESMDLLESINEAYEVIEDNKTDLENLDFKKDLFASTKLLKLKVTCSKLLNTWSKLNEKADAMDFDDCEKTFESCIASLAEIVARCIEYYRKVADMMLLTDFQAKDQCLVRAKSLKAVTEMFQHEVSGLSNKYANYLANNDEDKKTSDLITDIYMESENCCSLLQDSHELLLPILHSSAIK